MYPTRCNVTQFIYIWKLLYMFRVVLLPIIRSAYNCIYSIWYLSRPYCYLPLSWKSWNWFECAVGGIRHPQHTQTILIYIQQDATLHSLFYLITAHHPSSGAQTTLSTASGICYAVNAICSYRGRAGTGLS